MDQVYKRVAELKETILSLKEKYIALQATLTALQNERNKYLEELRKLGITDFSQLDSVLEKWQQKVAQIESKIKTIRSVLSKFI